MAEDNTQMMVLKFTKPPIIVPRHRPAISYMKSNEQKHRSKFTSALYTPLPPPGFNFPPDPTRVVCFECGLILNDIQLVRIHLVIDHNLCNVCGFLIGFQTYEELQIHLEWDHFYCETCEWFAPSLQGLQQHNIHKHYMCVTCGEYFEGWNQLNGHSNCHRSRDISCILCDKSFVTLPGAFNYLEGGKCEGGATADDIQQLVSEYYENYYFTTNIYIPEHKWIYCHVCDRKYHHLSELLQHLEFRSCSEIYNQGTA